MASIFRKLIADMREERNMTVEQLSSLCGIPASELLDMENGRAKLPFTALIRIIRAFSPSSGSILRGRRSMVSVTYSDSHKENVIEEGSLKFIPLTSALTGGHMTPYILEIADVWPTPEVDMTGEYFVYLLEGRVEANLDGRKYEVAVGDSLYFDTTIDHSIKNIDDKPSKLLIVLD